ncbi:hypothetical protein [Aureimonas ureilytica]|uniref:hypothetical protein n=1 Tax=Aureimonas ureilytica TaxID=401562 RepID=UPI00036EED7B|nr:hypothetical protein [Aureimonas ureilytica]
MTHSHDTATPALSVESEYVLVPREPSEAMLRDGVMAWTMPWADVIPQNIDEDRYILAAVYRAMISAASAPNPSPAAKGGEAVVVPYDDFHAAYGFVPRSKVSPDRCLKTRLRALLRAEDLAHADEAEALATPSPQPADAVRELLREVESETPPDDQPRDGQGAYVYMTWETIDALRAALESDPAPAAMGWEAEAFAVSDSGVCQLIEACKRNGFPHTQSCLLELLERRKAAALARPLSQPAEAEAETFKRERDDARKALETASGIISDARGAWWYARNEAKGGHLSRIWDRLVASDDAARSASREGASDE